MKKVLLVGGGTGGHIMPLIPLIHELQKQKAEITLVAADQRIDRLIISENIPHNVTTLFLRTGKLRRYFSWENLTDLFRTIQAIGKAHKILKQNKPDVLFIKGGYVGVPFVLANFIFRTHIPVFTHESDSSAGLATRIALKFTKQHFYNFGENATPLFYIPINQGKNPYKSKSKLPQLLIFGGSLGGLFLNKLFEQKKEEILKHYQVTLITGKGKKIEFEHPDFQQFEMMPAQELASYIHFADIIMSRGGANSLFEIINAKKPSVIIPLPSSASRNDQWHNANYFAEQNLCTIFQQEEVTDKDILEVIDQTYQNQALKKSLQNSDIRLKADIIAQALLAS